MLVSILLVNPPYLLVRPSFGSYPLTPLSTVALELDPIATPSFTLAIAPVPRAVAFSAVAEAAYPNAVALLAIADA